MRWQAFAPDWPDLWRSFYVQIVVQEEKRPTCKRFYDSFNPLIAWMLGQKVQYYSGVKFCVK